MVKKGIVGVLAIISLLCGRTNGQIAPSAPPINSITIEIFINGVPTSTVVRVEDFNLGAILSELLPTRLTNQEKTRIVSQVENWCKVNDRSRIKINWHSYEFKGWGTLIKHYSPDNSKEWAGEIRVMQLSRDGKMIVSSKTIPIPGREGYYQLCAPGILAWFVGGLAALWIGKKLLC